MMRFHNLLAAAIAIAMLAIPAAAAAQTTWYIDDGTPPYLWEDSVLGPDWEWMAPDAIAPGDTACSYSILFSNDFFRPFYAATQAMDTEFVDKHFWAEIYLCNEYYDFSESVTVTLGMGVAGNPGSFTQVASPVTVTGIDYVDPVWLCGQMYLFDFGVLPSVMLSDSSLILKIEQPVDTGGRTHIWWDGECCPSALHMSEPTGARSVSWSDLKADFR